MAIQQVKKEVQVPSIEQIEHSVNILDKGVKVPLIPFKLPIYPILGLIPIVGDIVTLVLSGSINFHAKKFGATRSLQRKMYINALADCAIGSIPFFGDMFDFFFKTNKKNLHLLKGHIAKTNKLLKK